MIELVDARAPFSTHNPELDHMIKNKPRLYILTKKDLADPKATEALIAEFKRQGHSAIAVDLKNFKEEKKIVNMCRYQLKEKREKEAARDYSTNPTIPVLKSGDIITITANGYEDLTFKLVIDKDGNASLVEDDGQGDPYDLHVKIDGSFEAAIVGQKNYDGVSSASVGRIINFFPFFFPPLSGTVK